MRGGPPHNTPLGGMTLIFWLFLAPPLFIAFGVVLMAPALIARVFWEPDAYPPVVGAAITIYGVLANIGAGTGVWWSWRRVRPKPKPDIASQLEEAEG